MSHQTIRLRCQLLTAALLLVVCFQLQTMLPKKLNDVVLAQQKEEYEKALMDQGADERRVEPIEESDTGRGTRDATSTSSRSVERDSSMQQLQVIDDGQQLPANPAIDPDKERSIIYLHVGKTGGTSLDTKFRPNCQWYNNRQIQTRCFEHLQDDTKLSRLVVNTFHMSMRPFNRKFLHRPEDKSFLITLRNPIARIVSAFNYEHPKNRGWGPPVQRRFYNDCYDTFPKLLEGITSDNRTDCSETAVQMLRGEGPHQISGHIYWNIQHHAHYIPSDPSTEVFVIRTENLWDDFNDLDRQLGGDAAVENHKADYGSSNFVVKSGVSFPDGSPQMIQLCCILQVETATYQNVLLRALNLNEQQKRETLEIVYQQCGAVIAEDGFPVDWSRWAKRNQCKEEYGTVKQIEKRY